MEALITSHSAPVNETELARVVQQFQQWRASRQKIERIPEGLWQAAASLYPGFSVCQIARALRLDFVDIRDRIHGKGKHSRSVKGKAARAERIEGDGLHFMELPAASPAGRSECSVKLRDGPRGTHITIRLKGAGVGALLGMLQGLWARCA